jgi:hypothetical protein
MWDYLHDLPDFAGKEKTFELDWLTSPELWNGGRFGPSSDAVRRAYRDRLLEWFDELDSFSVSRHMLPLPQTDSLDEYLDYLWWFSAEVKPHVQPSRTEAAPGGRPH